MRTRLFTTAAFTAFGCLAAFSQQSPISIHSRTLVGLYFATNPNEELDPGNVYFFTPSIGGNGEMAVRYHPDSSRVFFETGLCVWLWNYRAALNTRETHTQYHGWKAGRAGASAGIPFRAGFAAASGLEVSAGVVLLQNLSGGSRSGYHFHSTINGEELDGEAHSIGRTYTSLAFDLTAAFRVSRRFDVLLRGAMDTKAYPEVEVQHRIMRSGNVQEYGFRGAPKLAFFGVGAGFRF